MYKDNWKNWKLEFFLTINVSVHIFSDVISGLIYTDIPFPCYFIAFPCHIFSVLLLIHLKVACILTTNLRVMEPSIWGSLVHICKGIFSLKFMNSSQKILLKLLNVVANMIVIVYLYYCASNSPTIKIIHHQFEGHDTINLRVMSQNGTKILQFEL